jgi:hypothetical protein
LIILGLILGKNIMGTDATQSTLNSVSDDYTRLSQKPQSCRNINLRPENGRSLTFKRGTSGTTCGYKFDFQSDGNLVLYKSGQAQALWATGTDRRGEILVMQSDGNLVIYGGGRALWATNTDGNPGAFLAIQADGNLVIYRSNGQQAIWASNTAGAGQPTPSQPSQNSSQPIAPLTSLSTIPTCLFGTAC